MRINFLRTVASKTVPWLVFVFYLCWSFLALALPAQAAQRNADGERYAADNNLSGQEWYGKNASLNSYSTPVMTRGYVLVTGDTLDNVAKRYNLTVEGLRRLNQDHFFKNGFDRVTEGDTIYVPVAPVSDDMARYLEGDASQNGAITSLASQAGNFLSDGGHTSELQSMATGYFSGKANGAINRWFNQFGTARIQLNVDDGFSLKNSQFEMLLPIYDKGNTLAFTQTSIHRTDDRTQSNLGVGYRYFTPDYMIGGNAFWDYDISRSHSRMGVGVEYWRDYLKLSMNGYYRLSDWRSSPEVEDYYERPANGWDIRAEGYLPSYPKLGMKLNFEQYYGEEVGLFGKNNRQKNPYAVTFGANYTPIPLLTFNVDHRQGASGKDDTRLGFQVNYRFGVPLAKQLDPDAVGDMRTLAGSRYDLVDRNNDIVLEYKKEEVIRLYMVGGITGFHNEKYSLGISVESKYDVANVSVVAASLIAAGGKIVQGNGVNDYSIILPPYQPNSNNSYTVNAVAKDVKGNSSNEASTTVTVNAPQMDGTKSTFLPKETILPADNVSAQTLTLSLKTTTGEAYDVAVNDITLNVTGKNTAKVDPSFRRVGAGVYEITVTAGTTPETLIITPSIQGVSISSAKVQVVPDIKTAHVVDLVLLGTETSKIADGVNYFDFQATVRDGQGNLVPDAVVEWTQDKGTDVILSSTTRDASGITSKTNSQGVAVIRLTSTKKPVANIRVSANVIHDTNIVNAQLVSFVPDTSKATLVVELKDKSVTSKIANGTNRFDYIATVKDSFGNALSGVTVNWSKAPDNDATLSAATSTTDASGVATVTLTSSTKAVADIVVTGKITTPFTVSSDATKVSFVPDTSRATLVVELKDKSVTSKIANGTDRFDYIATVKDSFGNALSGVTVNWSKAPDNDATLSSTTSTTDASGVATVTLTSSTKAVADIVVTGKITTPFTASSDANKVSFMPDLSTAKLIVDLKDKSVTRKIANGTNHFDYVATVKDSYGNALSGITVNWSKAPDNDATLSSTTSTTDATGVATVTLTSTKNAATNIVVTGRITIPFTASSDATKVNFFALTFQLEPKDKYFISDVSVQYKVIAVPSDGSANIEVPANLSTWTSTNLAAAPIQSNGSLVTVGNDPVDVKIGAKGAYEGLDYDLTTNLYIRPKITIGPYGESNGSLDNPMASYVISAPSYQIYIRSHDIIDALGTDSGASSGGTGGQPSTVPLLNLKKIDITWGNWAGDPERKRLIKLVFTLQDNTVYSFGMLGSADRYTNMKSTSYNVPDGYQLQGINVVEGPAGDGAWEDKKYISQVGFVFVSSGSQR
ncbi:inverse autotransporter beta domain-containing protein [uncultured Bartonella sp.]|uniref:inverse autotransporter beta domain-containing protein n=1 Tax=uncultured Bartonella sp. TaxID=104108 RepID=UPI0025E20AAF|nr:inverse autotransporter beta domain-containing protein [uncultured Bartonella sp.]